MSEVALEARGLSKRHGEFLANDAVSLKLERGARHALIGPNGAGKTTLVNLLSGEHAPSSGEVFLEGRRVTHLPRHQRVRRGLTRTFQINSLFPGLTPFESVLLAVLERSGRAGFWHRATGSFRRESDEAWQLLESLRLAGDAHVATAHLAYGKQRLLELGLAIATQPRVLLLDEPASGVPAAESREMFEVIAALPRDVTILLIEHDMDLVFRFSERISVMSSGSLLAEGSPDEISRDSRVRQIYLGEAAP